MKAAFWALLMRTPWAARWYRFLLRFGWRHKQLGCAVKIGTSCMGEPMWMCPMHNLPAL